MSRERRTAGAPKKACCLLSEVLEEAGIDRERLLRIRRQVLEGIILMCQWQLQRMEQDRGPTTPPGRRGRKVEVE